MIHYPDILSCYHIQGLKSKRFQKTHVFQWPSTQWWAEMVFTTYLQFKESFEKGLNLDFPVLMSPMDCCNRWGPLKWSILLVTHHSCTYTVNASLSEEFVKYLQKLQDVATLLCDTYWNEPRKLPNCLNKVLQPCLTHPWKCSYRKFRELKQKIFKACRI